MIGDYLYRLTPRDDQVTPVQQVFQFQQNQALAATFAIAFVIPRGYNLLVQNFWARGSPGAAQSVTAVTLACRALIDATTFPTNTLAIMALSDEDVPFAVNLPQSIRADAPLIFDSRLHVPVASFAFNAGVAQNVVQASICGLLVPAGNFAGGQLTALLV